MCFSSKYRRGVYARRMVELSGSLTPERERIVHTIRRSAHVRDDRQQRARFCWGMHRLVVALLLVALNSGCAIKMYSGPSLPKERIAILYRTTNSAINKVDGKWPGFVTTSTPIHLLPGEHTVTVHFSKPTSLGTIHSLEPINVTFDAAAGRQYEVIAQGDATGWRAAIRDRATQERVDVETRTLDTTVAGRNVSNEEATVIAEETTDLQDPRIEVLLDKWERTQTLPTATEGQPLGPHRGNDFLVVYATITRIKGVHVVDLGARGDERSTLQDNKGNTYKLHSWHARGVSFAGGSLTGPSEFVEGTKMSVIFEISKDATPAHLRFVYYYKKDWGGDLQRGIIEVRLPKEQE